MRFDIIGIIILIILNMLIGIKLLYPDSMDARILDILILILITAIWVLVFINSNKIDRLEKKCQNIKN